MPSDLELIEQAEQGEAGPIDGPVLTDAPTKSPIESPTTTKSDITLFNSESTSSPSGTHWLREKLESCAGLWRETWDSLDGIEVQVRRLEDCPEGYPRLAAFLDSADEFTVYRRFGWLQSRLLLRKQGELHSLEAKLGEIDQDILEQRPVWLQKVNLPQQEPLIVEQQNLLTKIETKWCEYAHLLKSAQEFAAFNKPSTADYRSVANYMGNGPRLTESDRSWYLHHEDLVTLRPGREHAWLDRGLERTLRAFDCAPVRYLFCSKETRRKSQGPYDVYFTRSRIENLVNAIILAMILMLLIVPIWVLFHLINDIGSGRAYAICVGVLLISTLAFSAVLSLFTSAKRHEILAAAAAYCAVLVVFYGNAKQS